jgi:hypothetical protein
VGGKQLGAKGLPAVCVVCTVYHLLRSFLMPEVAKLSIGTQTRMNMIPSQVSKIPVCCDCSFVPDHVGECTVATKTSCLWQVAAVIHSNHQEGT